MEKSGGGGGGGGGQFKCKTCGRWFQTYQALGGHTTGHRAGHARKTEHGERLKAEGRLHKCPVCGLGFQMGQALGGHMRRHRPVAADSSGIDLNLPPAEDVDSLDLTLRLGLGLGLGLA
ncbi:Zinc finger protein ZAT12 [Apostasia shenzhenica]|uniref:Zinc finger protein ZAT12 n=1 Tax=Apostasia shenzhenica TaxID=1088818 RepID=A0A2H9ZZ31_9ASPA|nr:Zinc finger protein ZAT12 [Apostasia shenzhenica]